jgi:hypothetical protein
MTTADAVRERALALARAQTDPEAAVDELQTCCGGRRVAAVRARQQMASQLDADPDHPTTTRAIQLLDELLTRLPA